MNDPGISESKAVRRDDWWMTLALVLMGIGLLIGFTFAGLNRLAIKDNQDRFQADTARNVAAAKAQSDAQIAQAKVEAAQQVAVSKAEVQRQLCALIAVLQPSPVSAALAKAEGCPPASPKSTVPERSHQVPLGTAVRPGPSRSPASRVGSRPPLTPSPSPRPTPTPRPSMNPTAPALVCLLTICLG